VVNPEEENQPTGDLETTYLAFLLMYLMLLPGI
jgi:hypothetical protein